MFPRVQKDCLKLRRASLTGHFAQQPECVFDIPGGRGDKVRQLLPVAVGGEEPACSAGERNGPAGPRSGPRSTAHAEV